MKKNHFIILIFFLCFSITASAQNPLRNYDTRISNVLQIIQNKEYKRALDTLLVLDSIPLEQLIVNPQSDIERHEAKSAKFAVTYHIAECYVNISGLENKAIEYYKEVEKENNPKYILDKEMIGLAYFADNRFEEAKKLFIESRMKAVSRQEKERLDLYIKNCQVGIELIQKDTTLAITKQLNRLINTAEYSEISPYVTDNDSTLYFVRLQKLSIPGRNEYISKIMRAKKTINNSWVDVTEIHLKPPPKDRGSFIDIAGIHPKGDTIYILSTLNGNKDIYKYRIEGNQAIMVKRLNNNINSAADEGKLCLSTDDQTMYFASSRIGSYGKKDIYKSVRMPNNEWGPAINLGPNINSKYDEDAPFFNDEKNVLYFASEDNSMGKHDILYAQLHHVNWKQPKNIGFPHNTIHENLTFSTNKHGTVGYYAAITDRGEGLYDIFAADMRDNINHTFLSGEISKNITETPMNIKLIIIDRVNGNKMEYVYDTDYKTGNFIALLKPGRYYDFVIEDEAKEFLSQLITVQIPRQTYFYSLDIQLLLEHLELLNKKIGESIEIESEFYDANSVLQLSQEELEERKKYYGQLLQLMDSIMNCEKADNSTFRFSTENPDSTKNYKVLLNLVNEAIDTNDSIKLDIIYDNAPKRTTKKHQYIFPEDFNINQLETITIDGRDIKVAPRCFVKPQANIDELREIVASSLNKPEVLIPSPPEDYVMNNTSNVIFDKNFSKFILYTIYFKKDEDELPRKALNELEYIAEFLVNQYASDIVITAYYDANEYNPAATLSEDRINTVIEKFSRYGVNKDRFISLYKLGNSNKPSENRRIEIQLSGQSTWLK